MAPSCDPTSLAQLTTRESGSMVEALAGGLIHLWHMASGSPMGAATALIVLYLVGTDLLERRLSTPIKRRRRP